MDREETTNEVRDALIAEVPEMAGIVMARDQIVDKWCADHGIEKNALELADILAIRALPEWRNVG